MLLSPFNIHGVLPVCLHPWDPHAAPATHVRAILLAQILQALDTTDLLRAIAPALILKCALILQKGLWIQCLVHYFQSVLTDAMTDKQLRAFFSFLFFFFRIKVFRERDHLFLYLGCSAVGFNSPHSPQSSDELLE